MTSRAMRYRLARRGPASTHLAGPRFYRYASAGKPKPNRLTTADDVGTTALAWDLMPARIIELAGMVDHGEMAPADAACQLARRSRAVERVELPAPGADAEFLAVSS